MMTTTITDFLLDIFDKIRDANARNAEKDSIIASLTVKFDAVLENQRQQKLDMESWLAKERKWNKEREAMQKTMADLVRTHRQTFITY